MSKILKMILGIVLLVVGLILFFMLYVMVILSQADYMKYIVTATGYLSVIIFTIGMVLFKNSLPQKQEKIKENK